MKKMRKISIEGCPEIGRGAHGIVYRTHDRTYAGDRCGNGRKDL